MKTELGCVMSDLERYIARYRSALALSTCGERALDALRNAEAELEEAMEEIVKLLFDTGLR